MDVSSYTAVSSSPHSRYVMDIFILEQVLDTLHRLPLSSWDIRDKWDDIYCYLHWMTRVIITLLAQNLPLSLLYTNNKTESPYYHLQDPLVPAPPCTANPTPASGPLHTLFPLPISCFPQPGSLQHFLRLLLKDQLLWPTRSLPPPTGISISAPAFVSLHHLSLWLYAFTCLFMPVSP